MIASALAAGVVGVGDVLLKFGGSVDILTATDRAAPDARLYLDYHLRARPVHPQRLHVDGRLGAQLVRANLRRRATPHAAAAEGLTIHQYPRPARRGAAGRVGGLVILPYFIGEKTPDP